MTSPPFRIYLQAQLWVLDLITSALSVMIRESKDQNNGSIHFFYPQSVLVSVHCCHSFYLMILIYIFLIYIFLQGTKQTHRHDESFFLKHIKGSQGEKGEKKRCSCPHACCFSTQSCHVICLLLERGFSRTSSPSHGWCGMWEGYGLGGWGWVGHEGERGLNPVHHYVIWWGASSISMRKVSMGVSPISLKKNKCSRHFRPMERSAGSRSNSFANLPHHMTKEKKMCYTLDGERRRWVGWGCHAKKRKILSHNAPLISSI